jgi:hypothetical protein
MTASRPKDRSMKTLYAINCGKGQYLSALTIKVRGKSGGKATATLSNNANDRVCPPVLYTDRSDADRLLELCRLGRPGATDGWYVAHIDWDGEVAAEIGCSA